MVFHLGDRFTHGGHPQAPMLLAGQAIGPLEVVPGRFADVVGVRFQPGGAWPFLRFPQQRVAGAIVDLTAIWGDRLRSLQARIAEASSARDRVGLLDAYLRALAPVPPPDLSGLSPRHHRRRFEDVVGIPPKLFARIRRFQQALRALEAGTDPLSQVAAAAGYFDQSHCNRDFVAFSGFTPAAWRRNHSNVLFVQDGAPPEDVR